MVASRATFSIAQLCLAVLEKSHVDHHEIVYIILYEIFDYEIENTRRGEGISGLSQKVFCLVGIELQCKRKCNRRILLRPVILIAPYLRKELPVDICALVDLCVGKAFLVYQAQKALGPAL